MKAETKAYAQLKFTPLDPNSPFVIPANAFVFGADGSCVAALTNGNRVHWAQV